VFQLREARLTSKLRRNHKPRLQGSRVQAADARTGYALWVTAVPVLGKWLPSDREACLSAAPAPYRASAEDPGSWGLAQLLIMSALRVDVRSQREVTRVMVNRRRTRVAIGVVLALMLLAAWLAFDQSLLSARATNFPRPVSTQDGHGSGATPGHLAGTGSSGTPHGVSEPARGDSLDRAGDAGVSSNAQGSYLSDAPNDAHAEEDGKGHSSAERGTTGTGGSGPGSGGAIRASTPSSTPASGSGPNPAVSTSSDALPSGPAVGTQPQFDASGRNGTAPQSGPAASSAPRSEPPFNAGQSGPPGRTTGPLVRTEPPGPGSNTGPDNPDRWGGDTSGPAAGSDASPNPIPVPVPPSLLLFGASALMLWFVSRE
jgi:hypothetical protein